jgi:hypothetical protein
MTREQRKVVTLSSLSLCGIIVCVFLRHSSHHSAITFVSSGLLLINFWMVYLAYSSNRRMPDTLIHLFPEPAAIFKERP